MINRFIIPLPSKINEELSCVKKNKPIKSKRIYIKSYPDRHETMISGIEFVDFMASVPTIDNILVLKGNYWQAEKNWWRFDLIEGKNQIAKLMCEDVNNYGDFCFIDYADTESISKISDEQIAELLYISNMFKPLKSPFFDVLQNKYAYLAHDDGWFCKLYCKDQNVPISVVMHKLQKIIREVFSDNVSMLLERLSEEICKLSTNGLLIELDISLRKSGVIRKNEVPEIVALKLYDIGEYKDMSALFNNLEKIRPQQASYELKLP